MQSAASAREDGAEPAGGFLDALDALADGKVLDTPRAAPVAPSAAPPVYAFADAPAKAAAAPAAAAWAPPAGIVAVAEDEDPGARAYPRYIRAVGRGFAVFTSPGNAITFVVLWLVLCLRYGVFALFLLSIRTILLWLIISGWYYSFLLNTVINAAGDDSDLPGVGAEDGWWDGVLIPCFHMLSAYLVAAIPGAVFGMILLTRMGAAVAANPGAVLAGGTPDPGGSALSALVLLFAVGMFIWPMLVLVVALGGGVMAMFRLDLIFATIRQAFPAYLLTVVAVYAGVALQFIIMGQITAAVGARSEGESTSTLMLLLPFLLVGVTLFFDIVTMRAIGYFYCHFKHKFAWTWG